MTDRGHRGDGNSGGPEFPLPVLSEYALLADGERGIMVGPRGDFVWMCAPRWDSDAMFSALIGGAGMAAAATMSLPERAEEGRNYDYRYA